MKFMCFFLPTVPGTYEERVRLRPIAHHNDRIQRMIEEFTELSKMAEDLGFDMIGFPEHFLHTEGLEFGSVPAVYAYIAAQTRHVKVGPIGYVLPGWNPLRLAVTIAWLDHLTKGRTFVGFARGYQSRWLNPMAQKLHVGATVSDQSEIDKTNREAFEEVFEILKLAWKDEPFAYKGKFYEFPYPHDEGTPWAAAEWTAAAGAPGEVVDGRVRKVSIVPKPYQKPHPLLFQAFSASDATILWAARNGVIPLTAIPKVPDIRRIAELYRNEAVSRGRKLAMGEGFGVMHSFYFGRNTEEALELAWQGSAGNTLRLFHSHFGFAESMRTPEDAIKYPPGKTFLPPSEITPERVRKSSMAFAGSVSDVLHGMDELAEQVNPEYLIYGPDQGLLPLDVVKHQLRMFGEHIIPRYRGN
jgi:alkanesulfonate monooxygenase SsuD/methylene tetrahydromethanopterin reductase-like flavin-dependent oxidoreductase (luciferase family)